MSYCRSMSLATDPLALALFTAAVPTGLAALWNDSCFGEEVVAAPEARLTLSPGVAARSLTCGLDWPCGRGPRFKNNSGGKT